MNGKKSLASEAVILSISKVTVQVFMLISVMILTRKWTLNEYGTYSQMQLVVNLFVSLLILGLPNSINYFVVNLSQKEQRNRYLSTYYTLNTILGVVIGVLVVLSIPLMESYFGNETIKYYAVFLAIIPLTKTTMNSIENVLVAYKRTLETAIFSLLHCICILAVALLAVVIPLSFSQYLILYLVIECVFTIVIYYLVNNMDGRLHISIDTELLKKVLTFSIPLGLASVAGTLHVESDKLIIGYFFNTEQLAIYANAAKELPVKFLSAALAVAIMPYLARKFKESNPQKAIGLWKDATSLSLIFHVFMSIGLVVFSKEAITFLYSDKYADGTSLFAIYSLTYIVRATSFGSLLAAMGDTKSVLITETIMLIVNVILNIAFCYIFGFIGPAIATVFVTISGALIILWFVHRNTGISISKLYPWKDLAVILSLNTVLGAVFFFVRNALDIEKYITGTGEALFLATVWFAIDVFLLRKKIKEKWAVLKTYS